MKPTILRSALFWTLAILVYTGLESWFLKDTLGPDPMPSHGRVALSRFVDQFWPVASVGLAIVLLEIVLLLKSSRKENR